MKKMHVLEHSEMKEYFMFSPGASWKKYTCVAWSTCSGPECIFLTFSWTGAWSALPLLRCKSIPVKRSFTIRQKWTVAWGLVHQRASWICVQTESNSTANQTSHNKSTMHTLSHLMSPGKFSDNHTRAVQGHDCTIFNRNIQLGLCLNNFHSHTHKSVNEIQ